ncbi:MAG: hypothetical protein J7M14_01855, partial [Planctomycetes bacterium]|nr:hypothetical protein [Planctomycetota bacterium]
FRQLEMWIDRKSDLPIKLISTDKKKKRTTVFFTDLQPQKQLDRKRFDDKIFRLRWKRGWTQKTVPLSDGGPKL